VSQVIKKGGGLRPRFEFEKLNQDSFINIPIDREKIKTWIETSVYYSPRLHE
jgi:hypothetical protein